MSPNSSLWSWRRLVLLLFSCKTVSSFAPLTKTIVRTEFSNRRTASLLSTENGSDLFDVVVCGAGPAGLLLAKEMAERKLKVALVDPALDRPWPNNYGVWMDEADFLDYADCCDHVWKEVGIVFDEDTPELVLERPYGRVNRKKLKARLMAKCQEYGVEFAVHKAIQVEHFEDQPSIVTTTGRPGQNQQQPPQQWKTLLVADATGFSRQFIQHNVEFDPGYQVTYGARFRVKDLGPYKMERMVLMDYSERHLHQDPVLTASNQRFPTFVYAMPLAENELFLEETVLVSRPGASSRDLQARLELRMEALGIQALEVLEEERAAIPMGGMDPVVPQRTLGFGATASLIHPASGYMVARAMELAPRVAQAVAVQIGELKGQTQSLELVVRGEQLDRIAQAGWDAVWPTDERRQRDFMHFGFELLCRLNPQELRDFFTGFFRLPNGLWQHFLSWRLSGVGHIVMGITVWATCIPKRFMLPMLLNSLPFLANRLVIPFASRGNFAEVDTDSLYACASTGNATLWEPEAYFPYLEELSKKDFGLQDNKVEVESNEKKFTSTKDLYFIK